MPTFDMSTVRTVTTGLRFPEGPIALDNGTVLVAEIEGGALTRVHPDGTKQPIDCGGGPNGAALGPDGAVYVCNDGGLAFQTDGDIRFPHALADGNDGGCLQRVDLATGAVDVVFTHVGDIRIGNLNDIVFDTAGGCYIVDTTNGAILYADPAARAIAVVDHTVDFPNGLGLSPDGATLYASETYSGRIVRWDVTGPGRLAPKREIFDTGGENHFDGLAIDGAGHVCVANLQKSGISVIDDDGTEVARFETPLPDPFVTNICFGGPRGDTAYICSSGRGILYAVQWPWPGLRLNYAR
jgi:gluconolactonase